MTPEAVHEDPVPFSKAWVVGGSFEHIEAFERFAWPRIECVHDDLLLRSDGREEELDVGHDTECAVRADSVPKELPFEAGSVAPARVRGTAGALEAKGS